MRMHHVGCAVESIESALPHYREALGFQRISETVEIRSQGVRVCFVEVAPGCFVELVESAGPEAPLADVLRRGIRYYHVCYAVEDVESTLEALRARRFRLVARFDSEAFGNTTCAFVYAPDASLIELCTEGAFTLL